MITFLSILGILLFIGLEIGCCAIFAAWSDRRERERVAKEQAICDRLNAEFNEILRRKYPGWSGGDFKFWQVQ